MSWTITNPATGWAACLAAAVTLAGPLAAPAVAAAVTDFRLPPGPAEEDRRRVGLAVTVAVLVVVGVVGLFFWPVWTGQPVTYRFWRLHVWLRTWV